MNTKKMTDVERKKDSGWLLAALLVILLGALAVSIVSGVFLGSANMDGKTVIDVLLMKLFGREAPELNKAAVSIVWELRLPRVLLAIAVGGGLAVAGAAMQAVTTNVMADPYILGASSGASAAVALAFFLGGTFAHSGVFISTFAFGGAMLALILVYAIGMTGGSASSNRLVLAGMAISVILTAVTHFFISMAPDEHTARSITSWTMGSLATARWDNIGFPILSTLIGSLAFILISRAFNLLSQGDETAVSLGVNVHLLKRVTIILVSLITGAAVSAGGVIGFVGFIIPHIVRMLLGADHRRVFPFSYLIGGLFLMWMDVLARTVIAPKELPIGVFTAFCGGPFFVWLLFRKKQPGKKARRVRHGK
jgi:iron complex transport system permease protein